MLDQPAEEGVADNADAVSVGDEDGAIEEAGFAEPVGARHIAVAVLGKEAAEDGVGGRSAAGPDGGNTRAHRVAGDQSAMTNLNARHIGDRVQGTGGAFEYYAEIAGARLGLCGGKGCEEQHEKD